MGEGMAPGEAAAVARLGAALRDVRTTTGLSLRGLAKRFGVIGASALVEYEHGRRLVPEDIIGFYEREFGPAAEGLRPLHAAALRERSGAGRRELAQLPADLADFAGRETELASLVSWATQPRSGLGVACLSGAPGIGKTSLAVRFAHQVADRFPDGQLFVDLQGTKTPPPRAEDLLGELLSALGVSAAVLPVGVNARGGMFRSLVRGKRLLVVLDNAADESQVRPLLPGHREALVVVTARGPLTGLDTAAQLLLGELDAVSAFELFRRVVGAERVAAELAQSRRIVDHCGGLPLATRLAAAQLTAWPRSRLLDLAEQLGQRARRLESLRAGDRAVRGAFEASYQALPASARTVFRRLALMPGPDFAMSAAPEDGERAVAELVRRGLLQPSAQVGRYRLHDLIRLFAAERLDAEESPAERETAERALLHTLLHDAVDAGSVLDPSLPTPADGRFRERASAVRWLDTERRGVVAAVRRACELGMAGSVFGVLAALPWYWDLRCHWEDWREANTHVLALAERMDRLEEQLTAHNGLSIVSRQLHDPETAICHAQAALAMARKLGRLDDEACALDRLGCALGDLGAHEEAVEHLREACRLNEEVGDVWASAASVRHLGHVLHACGRLREAAVQLRRAVGLFGEHGAWRSEAMARCWYGDVLLDQRAPAQAAEQYEAARDSFTAQDDAWGVALARLGLGRVYTSEGDTARATRELTAAAETFAALRDSRHETAVLRALSALGSKS
ncbi:tetratricopeptide repeat protein [Amycolatopsis sp. NPDC049691]|uniref:ATP-binding protein n=1 Tax=Amycolatopsis sp. NPDC049691 TaxID=3155155 RepID=UPI00341E933C